MLKLCLINLRCIFLLWNNVFEVEICLLVCRWFRNYGWVLVVVIDDVYGWIMVFV